MVISQPQEWRLVRICLAAIEVLISAALIDSVTVSFVVQNHLLVKTICAFFNFVENFSDC